MLLASALGGSLKAVEGPRQCTTHTLGNSLIATAADQLGPTIDCTYLLQLQNLKIIYGF